MFGEDAGVEENTNTIKSSALALLKQQQGKKQVVLLGHSRGGAVAAYAAGMQPQGVSALVLIDPVDDSSLSTVHLIQVFLF